ncbi:hypothetical protein GRJ2_001640800 [Grus japonensis]|uniref:Uncharacterized protein n=1 Tax=Grus japonensis TaxID=30415 RepID=A0ABC9X247_GRUJA
MRGRATGRCEDIRNKSVSQLTPLSRFQANSTTVSSVQFQQKRRSSLSKGKVQRRCQCNNVIEGMMPVAAEGSAG